MTTMTLPLTELGRAELATFAAGAEREWLVTNGLGGYAAGSIGGARTRRYHGLLVAALKPPVQRTVLVAKLDATARYRDAVAALGSNEYADGTIDPRGFERLEHFRLEGQTPVWQYVVGDALLEQRVTMVHGENTTLVSFKLLRASAPLELTLRPFCTYRDYHGQTRGAGWTLGTAALPRGVEVRAFDGAEPYRLEIDRGAYSSAPSWYWNFKQRAETARGLDDREDLFVPGEFRAKLEAGETVTLRLATAAGDAAPLAFAAERQRQQHVLAAAGVGSEPDWVQRLVACGRSVHRAAWHGRERPHRDRGLSVVQRLGPRHDDRPAGPGARDRPARRRAPTMLRTFAQFVSEGMLPNRFPDAGEQPEYNTVDATLWYFHALDAYFGRDRRPALLTRALSRAARRSSKRT